MRRADCSPPDPRAETWLRTGGMTVRVAGMMVTNSSILTYTMLEYTHVYSSILPYIGLREILDFQGIGEFRNILDIQANPI